jgi:hypothetical protein
MRKWISQVISRSSSGATSPRPGPRSVHFPCVRAVKRSFSEMPSVCVPASVMPDAFDLNVQRWTCGHALRDHRLPLRFAWIPSSSGMLRSVGSHRRFGTMCWSRLQVSRCWIWDRYVVLKRKCETNLRCVTSQKTIEFMWTDLLCIATGWLTMEMLPVRQYLLS